MAGVIKYITVCIRHNQKYSVVVALVVKALFHDSMVHVTYIVIFNGKSSPNTLLMYTYNKALDKLHNSQQYSITNNTK